MWLFHLHSAVKNTAFFLGFPLSGSTVKAFFRLFFWSFKEKSINHFLEHGLLLYPGRMFPVQDVVDGQRTDHCAGKGEVHAAVADDRHKETKEIGAERKEEPT